MPDKMSVLYIEEIGQVVGALTRTAAPDTEHEVSELAGDPFLLRAPAMPIDPPIDYTIPAKNLAVASVDFDRSLLTKPGQYQMVDGKAAAVGGEISSIRLSGSNVVITVMTAPGDLPVSATAPIPVWLLLQHGPGGDPAIAMTEIATDTTTSVGVYPPVQPGTYNVTVAAAGYQLFFSEITIL